MPGGGPWKKSYEKANVACATHSIFECRGETLLEEEHWHDCTSRGRTLSTAACVILLVRTKQTRRLRQRPGEQESVHYVRRERVQLASISKAKCRKKKIDKKLEGREERRKRRKSM